MGDWGRHTVRRQAYGGPAKRAWVVACAFACLTSWAWAAEDEVAATEPAVSKKPVVAKKPVATDEPGPAKEPVADVGAAESVQDTPEGDLGDTRVGGDAGELVEPANDPAGAQGAPAWHIVPHMDVGLLYDDNIFITPRNKESDLIGMVSPGLTFGFWDRLRPADAYLDRLQKAARFEGATGNYVVGDYTASMVGFARHKKEDFVAHDFSLDGVWTDEKLTFGAHFRFLQGTTADVNFGQRIKRRVYTAGMDLQYRFTEKTWIDSNLRYTQARPQDFDDAWELRLENWLNYQATPFLALGAGLTVGRLVVSGGGGENFQEVAMRASYSRTEKWEVHAGGGWLFRQGGFKQPTRDTPTLWAGFRYKPLEGTDLSFEFYRRLENSPLESGRDFLATGFNLRLRHFVWRGIHLTCDTGWQTADYMEPFNGQDRRDHYFFVRPAVLYNVGEGCTLEAAYVYRHNTSSADDFGFSGNQLQVQLSFRF